MLYSHICTKRGRMALQAAKPSGRGLFLLVLVLGVSALLGGLYGPAVRATAAGSDDMQESVTVSHPASIRTQFLRTRSVRLGYRRWAGAVGQVTGHYGFSTPNLPPEVRISAKGLKTCDPSVEAKQHP